MTSATGNTIDTRALALDAKGLDALKRTARGDPDKALVGAAKQFEAVFMQMLLKSMRDAVPQSDLLGDGGETKTYTAMLDQELAQRLGSKGVGIADMIVKQLQKAHELQNQKPAAGPEKVSVQMAPTTRAMLERLSSATGAAGRAGGDAQAFVNERLADAQAAERMTGVPARFILGQAALESGWGRREIRGADGANSFNLFGIKAGAGWKGATVDAMTTEYTNGVAAKQVEKFRAYGSYREAFQDYARLIATNPRYADVIRQGGDAAGFAASLQRAGYATDPAYAEKLTRVINHTLALSRTG